ncbi:methyl- -binding domain 4-like [Brachionus plicatilis]|uniref:Methyl--binding domain 4-like n=1 Tax=Brachionus plicatilis TaxID=10195 RepID=A0A3M7RJZ5_BRAPC|nr:methyl- -binding domain 4-like [Brachionus plicatilis]
MTVLPDIVREAKIVSGKDNKLINEHFSSPSATNFDANQSNDDKAQKASKRHGSLRHDKHKTHFIFNDKNRSTSYSRATRSTDFINVKNSPIATNYVYNWKPVERLPSKLVQAKVKIYKPPKRIEMTGRPSSPYRVKVDYETTESTFHNDKRKLEMKRLQYLQAHTTWSIYPYAAVEEREVYNKKIRETLKEQIEQKDRQMKKDFEDKILEFKIVSELDQQFKNDDKTKKIEKAKYLMGYRDENKQLMEDRWMHNYLLKRHEWQQESQLLDQDPVNWSKTLR